MLIERIIENGLALITVAFAMAWIVIMVSAAATIPVVGFIVVIPAGLAVYAVHAAVTGQARTRIESACP